LVLWLRPRATAGFSWLNSMINNHSRERRSRICRPWLGVACLVPMLGCSAADKEGAATSLPVLHTHGKAKNTQPADVHSDPEHIDVPPWFDMAASLPMGASLDAASLGGGADDEALATLKALGFAAQQVNGPWHKEADLMREETMVPSLMPELPEVGAIALISTFRPQVREQYIYATLTSLFDALPESATINVFVGDENLAYISLNELEHRIGQARASRVHVIPTPAATAAYFANHDIDVFLKATWNYARALRSHRGPGFLLMCEDDIIINRHALPHLRPYLQHGVSDVFVLYNDRCGGVPKTFSVKSSRVAIHADVIRKSSDFPTTQAIVYEGQTAQQVGQYLAARAGREHYDYLVGRYLTPSRAAIGYVYPSVVQHVGFATTGLSAPGTLPMSSCYQGY
jgi:hypothetical protein